MQLVACVLAKLSISLGDLATLVDHLVQDRDDGGGDGRPSRHLTPTSGRRSRASWETNHLGHGQVVVILSRVSNKVFGLGTPDLVDRGVTN